METLASVIIIESIIYSYVAKDNSSTKQLVYDLHKAWFT